MQKAFKSTAVLVVGLIVLGAGVTSAQTPPAAPPAGGTFAQRLTQRKRERAVKLTKLDQQRISSRCVAAQGKIRDVQQKAGTLADSRSKTYQRIDAKLWVIIGQLKLANKDTFDLEKQRSMLAVKIGNFQTTLKNYQQTLDDLVVINCQADIAGFKAFLDTARIYHGQLRSASADVHSHVIDHIKPALAAHVAALQPKASTEGGE